MTITTTLFRRVNNIYHSGNWNWNLEIKNLVGYSLKLEVCRLHSILITICGWFLLLLYIASSCTVAWRCVPRVSLWRVICVTEPDCVSCRGLVPFFSCPQIKNILRVIVPTTRIKALELIVWAGQTQGSAETNYTIL